MNPGEMILGSGVGGMRFGGLLRSREQPVHGGEGRAEEHGVKGWAEEAWQDGSDGKRDVAEFHAGAGRVSKADKKNTRSPL
jgi:hypothetical protein